MTDRNDYNHKMIEEFHANGGKVGGIWEDTPLLLLTTRKLKTSSGSSDGPSSLFRNKRRPVSAILTGPLSPQAMRIAMA